MNSFHSQKLSYKLQKSLTNHLVLSFFSPSSSLLLHNRHKQIRTQPHDGSPPNIWMQAFFDTQRKDLWLQLTLFLLLCHIKNLHLSFLALFSVLGASWKLISPFFFFFKWRIIAFHCCCVSSCCTIMWIS